MTMDGMLDRETETRSAIKEDTYSTHMYKQPLRRDPDGSGKPVKVPDVSRNDNFSGAADARCLMYWLSNLST